MNAPRYIRDENEVVNLKTLKTVQFANISAAKHFVSYLPSGFSQSMRFKSRTERDRVLREMHNQLNSRRNSL